MMKTGQRFLPTGLVEAEDEKMPEELNESKEPGKGESSDKTVIALEKADVKPPENSPAPQTLEDLDAIASQIEFGLEEEAGDEGEVLHLDMSSPFDSLSFESPDFSGAKEPDPGDQETRKKTHQPAGVREEPGLEEIGGEGGIPFIYRPFLFRENKPLWLRPLEDQPVEPVREQDGIHMVNSDILDPKLETIDHLDPKFLRLVESILAKKI
jgi:hypothetical protein